MTELTVIAAGSLLMGDDGIGVRIIQQLVPRGHAGEAIEYLDGSVGGLRLLNWIEQAKRLLFVDAARWPGEPGSCRLFALDQLLPDRRGPSPFPTTDSKKGAAPFSLHQTDLLGVLALARQFYRVPPTWLLGVAVASVQPGDQLSEPLTAALPRLAETVRRLANRLATR